MTAAGCSLLSLEVKMCRRLNALRERGCVVMSFKMSDELAALFESPVFRLMHANVSLTQSALKAGQSEAIKM